ncbi:MAG TPA: CopG family transcriptional regulator [Solirubrobacterales bacterium]|nr:CopG family transcriptional regulator [Solirubrobacterales bacterium]
MVSKKSYGTTISGIPITDELIERLAKKAEAGFDVEETEQRRRGRPLIGSGPATVESVRLDPELRQALALRAQRDDEATSSVIRKALRQYLALG